MCWMCDHPEASFADALDNTRAVIGEFGWAVQYVEARTPWAYTVGLKRYGQPELLVTGMPPDTAGELLNFIAEETIHGLWLHPGAQLVLDTGLLLEVVTVEHPDVHLCVAVAIEGTVRAQQLVWSDPHGLLPWDPEFGHDHLAQPVLGYRDGAAAA